MNVAYNVDCMDYLRTVPDKYFDLACVDPPYGAGFTEGGGCKGWFSKYHHGEPAERETEPYNRFGNPGSRFEKYKRSEEQAERGPKIIAWDVAPGEDYFKELFRVSRNQIIWGGNYFALPPTRCFLVWRKLTISEKFTMAMCEYAWTSFDENAKWFECAPQGTKDDPRWHATQKPIDLYRWIFRNYAKDGYKILDTHLGSGSSRIAAYDLGLDFVGCEIDKEYFDKQESRFAAYAAQTSLFIDAQERRKRGRSS